MNVLLSCNKGSPPFKKVQFFLTLFKRGGGGGQPMFKNYVGNCRVFWRSFNNMKFAWKGTFEALMVKFGGKIGTLYQMLKNAFKKHPLQNRTNVQIKGGGGSKAFWTMFKKTALFWNGGIPYPPSAALKDKRTELRGTHNHAFELTMSSGAECAMTLGWGPLSLEAVTRAASPPLYPGALHNLNPFTCTLHVGAGLTL